MPKFVGRYKEDEEQRLERQRQEWERLEKQRMAILNHKLAQDVTRALTPPPPTAVSNSVTNPFASCDESIPDMSSVTTMTVHSSSDDDDEESHNKNDTKSSESHDTKGNNNNSNSETNTTPRQRMRPIAAMRRRLGKGKEDRNRSKSPGGDEDEEPTVVDDTTVSATVTTSSSNPKPGFMRRNRNRGKSPGASEQPEEEESQGEKIAKHNKASFQQQSSSTTSIPCLFLLTHIVADIGLAAAEAHAESQGWDVTICICDPVGIPILVKRSTAISHGSAASYEMAVQKAKMAAMFGQATGGGGGQQPQQQSQQKGSSSAAMAAAAAAATSVQTAAMIQLYPFLYLPGGVPLILNGHCCGAVGVSSGTATAIDNSSTADEAKGNNNNTPQEQQGGPDEQVAWSAVKAMADIYWSYQVLAADAATNPEDG